MKDKIARSATYRRIFAFFFMSMYVYKTEKITFLFSTTFPRGKIRQSIYRINISFLGVVYNICTLCKY